ncbi:AAA family ATPase [Kibdelosporangium persicum]|uniref:Tunicamycin resistance protein n=1 Tax=Kibdelosporangium persicum TaxID=2698649 RepID=A0ABX2FC43_9PSEU|nr:AAA family ATPase [Kibdelosporangium persicum]NRN68857.1 Tunicamycin resistance protein [Kibdelosporangium persicum]
MLIWINGPFGGGKTQTAYEIRRRLPGSVVCDPEEVGFGLHRMTPRALRSDFQDMPAWRQGVLEVLDLVLTRHDGPVIAPMTLINAGYFGEIVGRLRDSGHDVRHFALLAHRETVLRRLSGRGLGLLVGRQRALRLESFAVSKLDACLERLSTPEFAEQIWTDSLTVPQVADHIATSVGARLAPDTDSPLRGRLRRTWTQVRHVRFG